MSTDISDQIAGWMQTAERTHGPITIEELLGGSDEPDTALRAMVETTPRRPMLTVALTAAAVLVIVVVGVVALASSPESESPFVTTPPTLAPSATPPTTALDGTPTTTPSATTSSATGDTDPLPIAEGIVIEASELRRVVEGHEPFGATVLSEWSGQSEFTLQGLEYPDEFPDGDSGCFSGIVETPAGYTALGYPSPHPLSETALATSIDGVVWRIIENATDPTASLQSFECARLFEAGGWYWIGVASPVIYRSADTVDWEIIDLIGMEPVAAVGTPLPPQRWFEFEDRIVAVSGESLVSIHTSTGDVDVHPLPWQWDAGVEWYWMATIDRELTAFVSADPFDLLFLNAAPATIQYSTTDLTTWTGPTQPVLASGSSEGLLLAGDTEEGLLAYELTELNEGRYVSGDGLEWRGVRLIGGETDTSSSFLLEHVIPLRIGSRQGVAHLDLAEPGLLYMSVDGSDWQEIRLHDGTDSRIALRGFATSDNAVFYYEIRTARDGSSPVHWIWHVTFDPDGS